MVIFQRNAHLGRVQCPFNDHHYAEPSDMEQHKVICPDRIEGVELLSNSQKQQLDRQWAIVNNPCYPNQHRSKW